MQGVENPDIKKLFLQAQSKAQGAWPERVLANVAEYFANVGTAYLYGQIARNTTFTREYLKETQPDAYAWLEKEFGPR